MARSEAPELPPQPGRRIALVVVLWAAWLVPLNLWYIPSRIWEGPYLATGGLLHPTLVGSGVSLLLVLLLFRALSVRPQQLGLAWRHLPRGLAALGGTWLGTQLLATLGSLSTGEPLAATGAWSGPRAVETTGALLGQLLGNALLEEVLFRAFLVTALVELLRRHGVRRAVLWGVFLGAAVFAVCHIPNRLLKGMVEPAALLEDQARLLGTGMLFGWAWLCLRNVFVLAALHALVNQPAMLVVGPPSWTSEPWHAAPLLVMAALAWRVRRRSTTPRPPEATHGVVGSPPEPP
jgi:membrane protease YdiL (CAAX protease family)